MCKMIAAEQNFPNNAIIELYLSNNHGNYGGKFLIGNIIYEEMISFTYEELGMKFKLTNCLNDGALF